MYMYMTITCTVHINIMYNAHDYHMYTTHYNACTCVLHVYVMIYMKKFLYTCTCTGK